VLLSYHKVLRSDSIRFISQNVSRLVAGRQILSYVYFLPLFNTDRGVRNLLLNSSYVYVSYSFITKEYFIDL
jgi:hypothetical protein